MADEEPVVQPRLVLGLFCMLQQLNQNGLNSYNGVFDNVNVNVRPQVPLPASVRALPVNCQPFFYCTQIEYLPGECRVGLLITNSDSQPVVPIPERDTRFGANGKQNYNWHIAGLPIVRPGTSLITFKPVVNGVPVAGETVLTVNYLVHRER